MQPGGACLIVFSQPTLRGVPENGALKRMTQIEQINATKLQKNKEEVKLVFKYKPQKVSHGSWIIV
jgi:hypothetical protein